MTGLDPFRTFGTTYEIEALQGPECPEWALLLRGVYLVAKGVYRTAGLGAE